jgi:hypothetical protein
MGSEVRLRTGAWGRDADELFRFPDAWEIVAYPPRDAGPLTDMAIGEALAQPVGTERLSTLARGKRSAVVVVDDLTRPAQASRVIPFVLEELRQAGVPDGEICFVIGGGTHRPVTRSEAACKVGQEIAARYQVVAHDAYSGSLAGLGNLANGTPIYVSETVARSEVKIAVGGVIPHDAAGFGGGAKVILPGVAGIATVAYNHRNFAIRSRGTIEREGDGTDIRDNAEEVARHIGIDMGINLVVNSQRDVAGVFAGDIVEAHRAACRFARPIYETAIPRSAADNTDVVIINAYPQDYDPASLAKSLWPREVFERSFHVVVLQCTDSEWYHGLADGRDYASYSRSRHSKPSTHHPTQASIRDRGQMIALSTRYPDEEFYARYEDGALFRSWSRLVADLERICPVARVTVIPCSPLQLPVLT